MEKLISMVDYVLHESFGYGNEFTTAQDFIDKVTNYANFLKQPLTLGQFVPCDEDGNVLEEPNNDFRGHENYSKRLDIYNEAKSRVLFEGFEAHESNSKTRSIKMMDADFYIFWNFSDGFGWQKSKGINTIQDLVPYNLTLTPSVK